jgi:ABC-type transport system involved in multi-copper enzyme maturation permease subunit
MTSAVARKELLNHLASLRFWVGALLTIVLAYSSTWIAARDYNLRLRGYRDRIASARQALGAVSVYSYLQPLAVRPPEPLSVLDPGVDSRLGTDVVIHAFTVPADATGERQGNEFSAASPWVGLTTVVGVVLGLLALLLTCDAMTCEVEDGTLRAVLANGISKGAVLAGKFLGSLLAISLPLVGGLLASLATFRLIVGAPLTMDQWSRVAGLAGAYGIYLSLMLLLGLFISVHARDTPKALGISVLVWFVLTILVPALAFAVADDLAPAGRVERSTQRQIAALTARYDARLAERRRRSPLLATVSGNTPMAFTSGEHHAVRYRHGSARYYDALADYTRFETETGTRYAEEVFALDRRYEERLREGERLGTALAALSPAFLLDRLSESFAGTSVAEYDRFLASCRSYRRDLLAWLERQDAFRSWRWFSDDPPDRLLPWPRYLGLAPEEVDPAQVRQLFNQLNEAEVQARLRRDRESLERDPSQRLRLEEMPRFSYRGPRFAGALRRGAPEAAALLLLNAVTAAAVWARFRRQELGG